MTPLNPPRFPYQIVENLKKPNKRPNSKNSIRRKFSKRAQSGKLLKGQKAYKVDGFSQEGLKHVDQLFGMKIKRRKMYKKIRCLSANHSRSRSRTRIKINYPSNIKVDLKVTQHWDTNFLQNDSISLLDR